MKVKYIGDSDEFVTNGNTYPVLEVHRIPEYAWFAVKVFSDGVSRFEAPEVWLTNFENEENPEIEFEVAED